jgi:hypothetical protein
MFLSHLYFLKMVGFDVHESQQMSVDTGSCGPFDVCGGAREGFEGKGSSSSQGP